MSYHTLTYLIVFLPVVLCVYQIVPQRVRWTVLLLACYVFVWTFSGRMALWLAGTSLFTYYIGILLQWNREKNSGREKKILIFGIVMLLGALGYVKYSNFFVSNWNSISAMAGIPLTLKLREVFLPIGISFYTLQAIGYMIDVYWRKAEVCLHPGKMALFLGFFPLIMEGPICSYKQTADSLWRCESIRSQNLSEGSIRIVWGLFKKLIIADRLSVPVGTLFEHYADFHGEMIAAAAIAYTVQLYMEFSGCMDIVIGSGRLFGIQLPENFRQPFFATDAADFWRRWHISLGSWFRTYVFFPVSVSKPVKKWNRFAKVRFGKYITKTGAVAMSLFPVWLCNGLWHGTRWSYIFYGMYYFMVLLLTAMCDPLRDRTLKLLHIRKDAVWYRVIRILKTWVIIFAGELFFRAEGLLVGMRMFQKMVLDFSPGRLLSGVWMNLGLDQADYLAVITGIAVVSAVGFIKEKHGDGRNCLQKLPVPVRWAMYYGLIFSVIIFGAYGIGYQAVDLIYAGF